MLSHLPLAWQGLSFSPQVQAGAQHITAHYLDVIPSDPSIASFVLRLADRPESLKSAMSVSEGLTSHPDCGVACHQLSSF